MRISVHIIFKNHYLWRSQNPRVLLKIQWSFLFSLAFLSYEILGYMLICRNAEGVHAQRKVKNPWFN